MDARLLLLLVVLGVILQQEAVAGGSSEKVKDGDKPIDSKEKQSDKGREKDDSKNDKIEKEDSKSKPDNKPKQEGKKKNDDKSNKSANGKDGKDKVNDNSKKDKDNKQKKTEEGKDNNQEKGNKETDNKQEKDKKDKVEKPKKNKDGKDVKQAKSNKEQEEKDEKEKEKKPKKDKEGKDNKHEEGKKETDNSHEDKHSSHEKTNEHIDKSHEKSEEHKDKSHEKSEEHKDKSHEKSEEDEDITNEKSKEDGNEEHENSKESKEKSDEVVINKPNFNVRSELDFLDLDRMNMDQRGMKYYNLRCQPGRTVIKFLKKKPNKPHKDSRESEEEEEYEEQEEEEEYEEQEEEEEYEEEEEEETRRTHMNGQAKGETCSVCVCSAEGKDEYCSKRPARNVNECLRMEMLEKNIKKQKFYNHDSNLSYRIRRDYIWHDDEIPYPGDLKCQRGHSYYSNSETAGTIDTIASYSSVESYLDFENTNICFFCACSAPGTESQCIKRDRWFCDYYRNVRVDHNGRDRYRWLFKEDRPAYFRQLSYRLRRTMDTGIFDLIESVGVDGSECVPFVSEYSDCTDANLCSGCTKCSCTAEGWWSCDQITQCPLADYSPVDDNSIDNALQLIVSDIQQKKSINKKQSNKVAGKGDLLEIQDDRDKLENEVESLLSQRAKRALDIADKNETNGTIKFHHTVDELNEDTLKNNNDSGTVGVKMVEAKPVPLPKEKSDQYNVEPLHIDFNNQPILSHHITDNKINTTDHVEDKFEMLGHDKIYAFVSNKSDEYKTKELSKLIVNELSNRTEIIGDVNAPIISNITFTPENDTLNLIAFVAGNLLNKLWHMEKDSSEDSIENEMTKHKKIDELLELFKEPLTIKQVTVLKKALVKLSDAINKNISVSLCKQAEEARKELTETAGNSTKTVSKCEKNRRTNVSNTNINATTEAVNKVQDVLSVVTNYENIKKQLNDLKNGTKLLNDVIENSLSSDEKTAINKFDNFLERFTKLILPVQKQTKFLTKVEDGNYFPSNYGIRRKLNNLFDIDIKNVNLTTKDKLIFNYLTRLETSDCFKATSNRQNPLTVESDILLNLSQFFKLKSFADLMKLIEPEKHSIVPKDKSLVKEFENNLQTKPTTKAEIVVSTARTILRSDDSPLTSRKEKLKTHLKAIIEDLIVMQSEKGIAPNESNIKIADALPCIYKILNDKSSHINEIKRNPKIANDEKVQFIFQALKKDLKLTPQTRRFSKDQMLRLRPKSAVVWERLVKAQDTKYKQYIRRSLEVKEPKSFEDLNKTIHLVIKSFPENYKTLFPPPSERLLFLKTLQLKTKRIIGVLELINKNLDVVPEGKCYDINQFITSISKNTLLNDKITINKIIQRKAFTNDVNSKLQLQFGDFSRSHEANESFKEIRVTREQILNQLIKNRIVRYLKIKEAQGGSVDDLKYKIGIKILVHIETGNYRLARELYKVFLSRTSNTPDFSIFEEQAVGLSPNFNLNLKDKEAVHSFHADPLMKYSKKPLENRVRATQDKLLKQLLNLKNLKVS